MKATLLLLAGFALVAAHAQDAAKSKPIPADQLGAKAGKQYQGEGLSIAATPGGARLRCVFQRIEGCATREGLWLASTVEDATGEKFHVVSRAMERAGAAQSLPRQGVVDVRDKLVHFIRPGLTEEYSVSVDGVRQDFIIGQRPAGEGQLRVELDVAGAKAEALVSGALFTLDGSGRKIAYSRLRVVDAQGKELPARLEVTAATRLAVVVDDAAAVFPVRIDPTFSDADWISLGGLSGPDSPLFAGVFAAVADDSGNLYIGGSFTIAGEVSAKAIAKWNGSEWSALGSGMTGAGAFAEVHTLAVSGTNLYAGGIFTNAGGTAVNNIARWNGSEWSALASGMNSRVEALAVSGTDLYVGGYFNTAGGITVDHIAKWDGNAWSVLGSGMNDNVYALAVSGTNLYAGGAFTNAGGVTAARIAKWNGSAWSALGAGVNSNVNALAVIGTSLYAGGTFTNAGGTAANNIARWNGAVWSGLGSGLNSNVYALAVIGTDLYAGGRFTNAGGMAANRIAKWDGSAWSALGSGINSNLYALAVIGTNLYGGGFFTVAGGMAAARIAKWDGSAWSRLDATSGLALNGRVLALTVSGTDLYAGGSFTMAGGIAANAIAKWDGSAWSALGSGMTGVGGLAEVYILAVSGTNLYAGGTFTNAGGAAANNVARWNGSEWSALASGVNNRVEALAVSGTDLYAGGWFSVAGGTVVNRIAKWDGSAWSALGSGMNETVFALAVSGTNLYAGGRFDSAGGVAANHIAKWNGSAWSALGSGIGGEVYFLLASSGTNLYVGGIFAAAGGAAANNIAKWDGSAWSALGSGMNSLPDALAVSATDLYAGGYFTTAGGITVNHIAKWDGNAWSALGSGMNDNVYALALSGTNLYAGGDFTIVGNKVSAYAAKANLPRTVRVQDVTVTEGNSGTIDAVITISLSFNLTEVVSVDYATADGSAVAGSDYAARSGTLVFNPGETSQSVVIPVFGDVEEENTTENFFLRLSNPTNIALTVTQVVVTILDDDRTAPLLVAPVPALNLTAAPGEQLTLGVQVAGTLPIFCRWRMFRASGGALILTNQTLTERLSFITFTVDSNSAGTYVVHLTNSVGGSIINSHTNAFLTLLADADADGLPDVWEATYPTATDPALDSDSDGLTNLEEYRAGTDLTNAASVLRITRFSAGNPKTLEFDAVSNKTYTLQYTDRVPDGSWLKLLDIIARATNRTETATDARAGTNRYYRVVTPRQP